MIKKLGTGKVTFISCLMTGLSLLGFSIAPSYAWLLVLAIPLGFGAGSVDTSTTAFWVAMYYGGITIGRFLSGFISFKFSNNQMISGGLVIVLFGTILLLLPIPNSLLIIPLMLIGFGLSPIFPAMIHETPVRFGKEFSQIIIGYQMGFAYVGIATLPPLLGLAAKNFSTDLIPYFWVVATLFMIVCYISLIKLLKK